MWKKVAVAAVLLTVGILLARKRRRSTSFVEKHLLGHLSGTFKTGALGSLGATAPASAALPSFPLIPML